MVDICGFANILLNVAFVGTLAFGYVSILASFAQAQASWKPQWDDYIEKPEFSLGVEGFKSRDIRALSFFYMEKYTLIPDLHYREICAKVRRQIILFPCALFLLAMSLLMLPC